MRHSGRGDHRQASGGGDGGDDHRGRRRVVRPHDDVRQEFILWSDTLGLSMLVDALANPKPAGAGPGRHPWRPGHIDVIVSAPGFEPVTHIFDDASAYLDSDVAFAVKPSLLRRFVSRSADDPDRPASIQGEWCSVENEVVLVTARGGS